MDFQISALSAKPFMRLYGQDDETLKRLGALRVIADHKPGFPCRVSLQDAEIGETLLLMNYEHQPAASPYRSSHAILIREGATQKKLEINEVPQVLRDRILSIRAFDTNGMLIDSDIVNGTEIESLIERLFKHKRASYLHMHNAKPGCYAASAKRA